MKTHLFFLSLLFVTNSVVAQYRQNNQEISVGAGSVTSEQIYDGSQIGLIPVPVMSQYTNHSVSGIWFLDYKYFLGKRASIGVFAGMERESGDWYYNNINGKEDDWSSQKIGTFSRKAFTLAAELSLSYLNHKDVRVYGAFGMGATFKHETGTYDTNYTKNSGSCYNCYGFPTGRGGEQPNNVTKFNAYFSPFGVSVGGNVRFFIELGVGYKGLISGGLSYRMSTRPSGLKDIPKHSDAPVILLPHDFPVGKDLTFIDHVESGNVHPHHRATFEHQLSKATTAVQAAGGNVFRISRVKQAGDADRYNVMGDAYYTKNYDDLKKAVAADSAKPFQNEQCVYVVVYCPATGKPDLDQFKTTVTIDDTASILVSRNSKYVLKLMSEGTHRISAEKNKVFIDAKFGHSYYLRLFLKPKRSMAHLVSNIEGELESSLVREPKKRLQEPGE